MRVELPSRTIDETGHEYGALLVIEFAGIDADAKQAAWLCQCRCGEEKCRGRVIARGSKLRSGKQVSCGAARGGIRPGAGGWQRKRKREETTK